MITATPVDAVPPLDHDEAMGLAEAEIGRVLALVDDLRADEWQRPTDCTGWTVRDMLGHLLGMMSSRPTPRSGAARSPPPPISHGQSGELRLTEMTALQVREHADLTTDELRRALHEAAPPRAGRAPRPARSGPRRAVRLRAAGRGRVDRRLPVRRRPPPRHLAAPRRHLPRHRSRPAPDRRPRRPHRRRRRGRLGRRDTAGRSPWSWPGRPAAPSPPVPTASTSGSTPSSSAGPCPVARRAPGSSPLPSRSDPVRRAACTRACEAGRVQTADLWFADPAPRAWTCPPAPSAPAAFHAGLPGYHPTPLHDLPALAIECGVRRVLVKDESARFGLPAFKALGVSYAIHRVLDEWTGRPTTGAGRGDRRQPRAGGRGVRAAARPRAHVVLPSRVDPRAVAAIRADHAAVTVLDGDYDEAVAAGRRAGRLPADGGARAGHGVARLHADPAVDRRRLRDAARRDRRATGRARRAGPHAGGQPDGRRLLGPGRRHPLPQPPHANGPARRGGRLRRLRPREPGRGAAVLRPDRRDDHARPQLRHPVRARLALPARRAGRGRRRLRRAVRGRRPRPRRARRARGPVRGGVARGGARASRTARGPGSA